MKTLNLFQCFLALGVALTTLSATAQTPSTLGIKLYAGVTITGTTSSVYGIQSTSNLADTNSWRCVALAKMSGTNLIWTDMSMNVASAQLFYRAVPTATNMVWILPGTFTMGSPTNEALRVADEVQHVVTISKGFYIGEYLVTQSDYVAAVGNNPSHFTGNLSRPVETVSWINATNYCALRTAQEQAAGLIPTDWAYRLPTESEWEYACRAGTTTALFLGTALHSQQANFAGIAEYDSTSGNVSNPSGVYLQTTTPVGNYAPNDWGLYDMAGNVFEWCQDWYGAYPSGSVTNVTNDPQGAASGTTRVLRGGGWSSAGSFCRSAKRDNVAPSSTTTPAGVNYAIGFRVVLAQTK